MLKIPPPLLVLILVIANYFSSKKIDLIHLPNQDLISILILLIGILILINPIFKFIKSKTTIDPIKFKKVNKLITSGIYKYSRNPMYLGMALILLGLALMFNLIGGTLFTILFTIFITKFQIRPEEEVMEKLFGEDFLKYKKNVRMWL